MQMKTASAISTGLHLAVLAFAVVSFSGKTFEITPAESLPVDLVSEKEFSQMTKGAKDAPKKERSEPLVEKKAEEVKPVEESKPKVTDKQEVKPAQEKAPTPPPEPEKKPADKNEAAADKPPDPVGREKADPIAEKLKQEKAEIQPMPPRKPPQKQQPKFNASEIAALINQREPQRHASAGNTLNSEATLGRAKGTAAQLSQDELAAFRERIKDCWTPPLGAENVQNLQVVFRVLLNQNGTVRGVPQVVEASASAIGPIFAESAKRAMLQCQPYTMLHQQTYEQWKDMEVVFNLRDMFR